MISIPCPAGSRKYSPRPPWWWLISPGCGSRARGEHRPGSDWDLGVYYRGPLDLAALQSLAGLQAELAVYPEPLRTALMGSVWEAEFLVGGAAKGAARADVLYVSLCLSRAVGIVAQALHADARRWCLNEKGALVTDTVAALKR